MEMELHTSVTVIDSDLCAREGRNIRLGTWDWSQFWEEVGISRKEETP